MSPSSEAEPGEAGSGKRLWVEGGGLKVNVKVSTCCKAPSAYHLQLLH